MHTEVVTINRPHFALNWCTNSPSTSLSAILALLLLLNDPGAAYKLYKSRMIVDLLLRPPVDTGAPARTDA